MKFIADAMLGRLAKWLRILGFDVLYYPDIDDRRIVRISREQERTILTRDTQLLKRKGLPGVIFINKDDVFEQLTQLKEQLDFSQAAPSVRCVECNGFLDEVSQKEEIRNLVPDFVYLNSPSFVRCRDCGKVYWEGSHRKKIRKKLLGVLSDPLKRRFPGGEEGKQ
jgi:uncharacterized protein with PIN domain